MNGVYLFTFPSSSALFLLVQELFDIRNHHAGLILSTPTAVRLALGVNEELVEVPANLPPTELVLEEGEDLPGIFAVDVGLLEEDQLVLHPHLFVDKRFNVRVLVELLVQKLTRRECQNLESSIAVLVGEGRQLAIVSLGHASFGSDIYYEEDISLVGRHGNGRTVNELVGQLVKRLLGDGLVAAVSGTKDCALDAGEDGGHGGAS